MQAIVLTAEFASMLDLIAIACSLILIMFLMMNRRRYGRFILSRKPDHQKNGFSAEMSLQMINQQSQKAYANIQETLSREFETLQQFGGMQYPAGSSVETASTPMDRDPAFLAERRNRRPARYRQAQELLAEGVDHQKIITRCSLGTGELELLQSLRQFAREVCPD